MYYRLFLYTGALVLFVLGASLGLSLVVGFETNQYIYSNVPDTPNAQVAMILGASVLSNGTLSPVLEERVNKAIELYKNGTVSKILMTGDNAAISHNEVEPVRKYLLKAGIPGQDIFLDHAGFDTYSSMYRARDVFGVHSMIIVSQPFHLPRAVLIARSLGLDAYGEKAETGEWYVYNTLREVPADIKALSDLALRRVPKYLGPMFPITGDGSATWE